MYVSRFVNVLVWLWALITLSKVQSASHLTEHHKSLASEGPGTTTGLVQHTTSQGGLCIALRLPQSWEVVSRMDQKLQLISDPEKLNPRLRDWYMLLLEAVWKKIVLVKSLIFNHQIRDQCFSWFTYPQQNPHFLINKCWCLHNCLGFIYLFSGR
jgi:hypothetical protein